MERKIRDAYSWYNKDISYICFWSWHVWQKIIYLIQNFEISIAYSRSSYISKQKIGCSRDNIFYRNSFLTLMLLLEKCNEDKEIYYCCIVSILLYCFVLQNWSVKAITVSNLTSLISAANTGFMCSSLTRFYLRKSC